MTTTLSTDEERLKTEILQKAHSIVERLGVIRSQEQSLKTEKRRFEESVRKRIHDFGSQEIRCFLDLTTYEKEEERLLDKIITQQIEFLCSTLHSATFTFSIKRHLFGIHLHTESNDDITKIAQQVSQFLGKHSIEVTHVPSAKTDYFTNFIVTLKNRT